MAWLATLVSKLAAALAPSLVAWLSGLVREWLASRQSKKEQEQADKDLEESKNDGRPRWTD